MTHLEDYMNELVFKYEKDIRMNKKLNKIPNENDNLAILTIDNYKQLTENNYNIQQLKIMAKFYKLKLSGNKKEVINRLYIFLFLSSHISGFKIINETL